MYVDVDFDRFGLYCDAPHIFNCARAEGSKVKSVQIVTFASRPAANLSYKDGSFSTISAAAVSSDDPGPWDPAAGEPSLCPRKFQDLAEPDPLETDVAFVSNAVTRAARLLTICSIFVIFASHEATVWESVSTQFSNLDTLCLSCGGVVFGQGANLLSESARAGYPRHQRSRRCKAARRAGR